MVGIEKCGKAWRGPNGAAAGQPVPPDFGGCGENEQGPRCTRSVTPPARCGKKPHTLTRLIGVRLIEIEPVTFGHAIEAASVDPEDLGGAFLVALGRLQHRLDVLLF